MAPHCQWGRVHSAAQPAGPPPRPHTTLLRGAAQPLQPQCSSAKPTMAVPASEGCSKDKPFAQVLDPPALGNHFLVPQALLISRHAWPGLIPHLCLSCSSPPP